MSTLNTKEQLAFILAPYARALSGATSDRYRMLLRKAFSEFHVILNAKQLRELVGGGSQTTAQTAIEAFRGELAEMTERRLPLGASIPSEVIGVATAAIEEVWRTAMAVAAGSFEAERASMNAQLTSASVRLDTAQGELESTRQRVASQSSELEAQSRQLREAEETRARLSAELEAARHGMLQLREQSERAAQDAAVRIERLEADLARAGADLERARSEASQRFDRLMVEHREQIGTIQRANETSLLRLVKERDAMRAQLDAQIHEAAGVQIERARIEQRLIASQHQLEEVQAQLVAAQAVATQAQEQLRARLVEEAQRARDAAARPSTPASPGTSEPGGEPAALAPSFDGSAAAPSPVRRAKKAPRR